MVSDFKRGIPKFDTLSLKLEQLATKLLKQNSNRHERIELWATSMKTFRNFRTIFPLRSIAADNPRSAYERVQHAMGYFVPKTAKLSHILEVARSYGLHLLVINASTS